jgi:hypothetical protein
MSVETEFGAPLSLSNMELVVTFPNILVWPLSNPELAKLSLDIFQRRNKSIKQSPILPIKQNSYVYDNGNGSEKVT